jgi:hypothetical protein
MRCNLLDTCNKIKIFLYFKSLVLSCFENYLLLGLSWNSVSEIECQLCIYWPSVRKYKYKNLASNSIEPGQTARIFRPAWLYTGGKGAKHFQFQQVKSTIYDYILTVVSGRDEIVCRSCSAGDKFSSRYMTLDNNNKLVGTLSWKWTSNMTKLDIKEMHKNRKKSYYWLFPVAYTA